jgi:ATP-dependent DNA ligase
MCLPNERAERRRLTERSAGRSASLKADGFRAAVVIDSGRPRIVSRRGNLLSFPTVVEAARSLPPRAAVLDGEVAVMMPNF